MLREQDKKINISVNILREQDKKINISYNILRVEDNILREQE